MSKLRTENAATLAAFLAYRNDSENVPETVEALQKTARMLHRNAERACCEDCSCRACDGQGTVYTVNGTHVSRFDYRKSGETADYGSKREARECTACAGTGLTFGKREVRAMERLREMIWPFGVHLHEQGDCRGWPLYLIPHESVPIDLAKLDAYRYPSDPEGGAPLATLRARWIASNYNRGIAVCPH